MHRNRGPSPLGRRIPPVVARLMAALVCACPAGAIAVPTVISTTPVSEAVGASRTADVRVRFAAPLDPVTVIPSNVLVTTSQQGTLAASVSWNAAGMEVVVNPARDFLPGERVNITLGKGVKDLSGQSLPNGWHFEFSAWTAPTPPGGFVGQPATWPIGSIAFNLTVADLSSDGFPEAIFSNVVPDSLTLLKSDGAGGFMPFASIALPAASLPRHVAIGDLDHDGRPDLVVCGSGPNLVYVLRNLNGNGSFAAPVAYATGATPYGAYVGDLDADGDLDVATANFNAHTVSILKNNGAGVLGAAVSVGAGAGANSPRWVDGADLDGDGDTDLVCCNGYSFDVSVFLNDGTGTFAVPLVRYPVDDSPQFCELRDFTGDRIPDLVTVNSVGESVSLLVGNGDGTFQPRTDFTVQGALPYGLHVVDLDGDRDLDLVLPIRGVSAWQPVWNDGSGAFTAGELHTGGTHCHTIGAADWDGDGDIDVMAGFAISKNAFFYRHEIVPQIISSLPARNAGGHAVDAPVELLFNVDLSPASVTAAAFTVTGAVSGPHDCAVSWSGTERKVTLQPQDPFAPGEVVTVVVAHDVLLSLAGLPYPGDSRQFMTAGPSGPVAYSAPTSTPLDAVDPTDVAAADLNGDGLADLAVCAFGSSDITVLLSGNGPVPLATTRIPVASGPVDVTAADLNDDGQTDLLVTSVDVPALTPLLNAGGTLSPAASIAVGGTPYAAEAADLDADGDTDLAVVRLEPTALVILRNDGGGAFSIATTLPLATPPLDVVSADLNRDGALDLAIVLPLEDQVRTFRRDTSAPGLAFLPWATFAAPDTPVSLFAWDLDGDAWVDLVLSSYGTDSVQWLANDATGGFTPPIPLAGVALPRGLVGTDVDGDAAVDLLALGNGDGSATVFANDGGGGFFPNALASPGTKPFAAAAGDLDGDGRVDFAIVDRGAGALRTVRTVAPTGAPDPAMLTGTGLLGTWPNPFRDVLTIRLAVPPEAGAVQLGVYDVAGRSVSRLHEGPWEPGVHEVRWDGRDARGRKVVAGMYFLRLGTSREQWTRKVLLLQ